MMEAGFAVEFVLYTALVFTGGFLMGMAIGILIRR
jgi:hypothetical protein